MWGQHPPYPPTRSLPCARRYARRALQLCAGGAAWRYPVCFITNGGGVTEATKARQLSQWLGVPVDPSQVGAGRRIGEGRWGST